MITENNAIATIEKLIKERSFSNSRWEKAKFLALKICSTAEKGSIAEDLLRNLLLKAGYGNAKLSGKGRRGDWDVSCQSIDGEVRFEVKVATLDIYGKHQFNGIRHDTDYTHLFLLGVMPNNIRFRIIAKKDRDQYTLVSMAKGTNTGFKLILPPSKLHSFDSFSEEVAKVLGSP